MRTIATFGILLLAGCGQTRFTETTPVCPDTQPDAALTAVRIVVDVDNKTVTPKNCYVYKDTEVGWWEAKGKPFETDFSIESPDKSGKMHFDSKPVGSHQEASLKANKIKNDDPPKTYNYKAKAGGVDIDPAIIVDPHKPTTQ